MEDRSLLSGPANALVFAPPPELPPALAALVAARQLQLDATPNVNGNFRADAHGLEAANAAPGSIAAAIERIFLTAGGQSPRPELASGVTSLQTILGAAPFGPAAGRFFPNDFDPHLLIARLEDRAHAVLDVFDSLSAPTDTSPPPVAEAAHAEFPVNRLAQVLPIAGVVATVPPTPRPSGDVRAITILPGEDVAPGSGLESITNIPVDVPPSEGPTDVSATPVQSLINSLPPAWREVFSASLAGEPIGKWAATDIHALDAATREFFDHLANLAPDWCPEAEWNEYALFVAGVLLAGGGSYFVRRARGNRERPADRVTRGAEEIR